MWLDINPKLNFPFYNALVTIFMLEARTPVGILARNHVGIVVNKNDVL